MKQTRQQQRRTPSNKLSRSSDNSNNYKTPSDKLSGNNNNKGFNYAKYV
jgi:hypothetical protein